MVQLAAPSVTVHLLASRWVVVANPAEAGSALSNTTWFGRISAEPRGYNGMIRPARPDYTLSYTTPGSVTGRTDGTERDGTERTGRTGTDAWAA